MKQVDSFRFTGRMIKKFVLENIENRPIQTEIPWSIVSKKINDSKVSLVTTAGISVTSDEPFDMNTEKKLGDWGDPSWRLIKHGSTVNDISVNHLHIDTS